MKKYEEIIARRNADTIRENDKRPIYIIDGAPGSGKTTYVKNHKQPGDIIVDMDMLAAALQGEFSTHPDYTPVMDAVISAREAIYNTIRNRTGKWKSAYIITSSSDAKRVQTIVEQLGGSLITMDVDLEQCINQIRNDPTRRDKERDILLAQEWYRHRKK